LPLRFVDFSDHKSMPHDDMPLIPPTVLIGTLNFTQWSLFMSSSSKLTDHKTRPQDEMSINCHLYAIPSGRENSSCSISVTHCISGKQEHHTMQIIYRYLYHKIKHELPTKKFHIILWCCCLCIVFVISLCPQEKEKEIWINVKT
jgi:hypothetical protein